MTEDCLHTYNWLLLLLQNVWSKLYYSDREVQPSWIVAILNLQSKQTKNKVHIIIGDVMVFLDTLKQSILLVLDEIEHSTVVRKVMEKQYTILLAKYSRVASSQLWSLNTGLCQIAYHYWRCDVIICRYFEQIHTSYPWWDRTFYNRQKSYGETIYFSRVASLTFRSSSNNKLDREKIYYSANIVFQLFNMARVRFFFGTKIGNFVFNRSIGLM